MTTKEQRRIAFLKSHHGHTEKRRASRICVACGEKLHEPYKVSFHSSCFSYHRSHYCLVHYRNWNKRNPGKVRVSKYIRKVRHYQPPKTPKEKIVKSMRRGIWKSLKGTKKRRSWESMVDYNREELMEHLESLFLSGMSWKNYGEWHIDHLVPIATFDFEDSSHPHFKACWSLANLQPMWAHDNLVKGGRVIQLQPRHVT